MNVMADTRNDNVPIPSRVEWSWLCSRLLNAEHWVFPAFTYEYKMMPKSVRHLQEVFTSYGPKSWESATPVGLQLRADKFIKIIVTWAYAKINTETLKAYEGDSKRAYIPAASDGENVAYWVELKSIHDKVLQVGF